MNVIFYPPKKHKHHVPTCNVSSQFVLIQLQVSHIHLQDRRLQQLGSLCVCVCGGGGDGQGIQAGSCRCPFSVSVSLPFISSDPESQSVYTCTSNPFLATIPASHTPLPVCCGHVSPLQRVQMRLLS
jgi:hypothetical protein